MIPATNHVLFFGDHMSDCVSIIRNLVAISKTSVAVRRLLDEAIDTLKLEFSRLSRLEHGWNQKFESLIELAEANFKKDEIEGGQNGIITCALICIARLGELVAHAERDASVLGAASGTNQPVEIVGLCMGLLPATVALAANDTSQIFRLASELIGVTIRMSYSIWLRMRLIEASPGSWSQTFLGVPVENVRNILDGFHEQCKVPQVRRIAVGVTSKGFVTLFGPPSTLAKLQAWQGAQDLRNAPQIPTKAGGCVHTPYLPQLDLDAIFKECSQEFLQWPVNLESKSRMASPSCLAFYDHSTLGGLLREVIHDIVQNIMRLDDTLESCASRLKSDGRDENVKLVTMGENGHVPAMTAALKKSKITHQIIMNNPNPGSAPAEEGVPAQTDRGNSGLIAIVGMSGRFPDNDTVQGFWDDLLDGKTHIREVPPNRFDVKSWYDPTLEAKNSTNATKGAWLANPGLFDHRLFNISPREAAQIDPIHRYFLTCSYEALQNAGYNPGATLSMDGSNVSTFFGQLGEDWHDVIHEQGADIYYVPGIARAFAASRVNYHFKFGGGSYAVDSACASSVTTVVLACQALSSRTCDMALAGGGSMIYTPVPFSGLSRSGMISTTTGCRAFHDDADGYARGEGIGVIVLKRLEDALADNDNILGVIRGSARTYSTTTTSITHPSHESQERLYRRVMAKASLDPMEIAYVEMHGTGTQSGDLEEITSVINEIAPPGSRSRTNPLTVGTLKPAVGHGEAAAGVTAIMKVLLMMRDKVIPAQPGWPFKINQRFPPLDPLNVRIATQHYPLKPSPKGDKRIKIMLNSFDASGGESCLVFEEPPSVRRIEGVSDPRTAHVVTLSGRTTTSLAGNRQRLIDWLETNPNSRLEDVAYTTTARRMHEPLRAAYVAGSVDELVRKLHQASAKGEDPKTKPKPAGRIFLFTGQGSEYSAMGSVLFKTNRIFREKMLIYEKLVTHMGMPNFTEVITNPEFLQKATPAQTQMAIVALEIAVTETLAQYGVKPTMVIGHSLGEYAALSAAGVLSVADTLFLVGQRALLMEKHLVRHAYAMLAVSVPADRLQSEFTSLGLSSCSIACKNAPELSIASGTIEQIQTLEAHMKSQGARTTVLRTQYGFHSSQVDPILDELTEIAAGVEFKAPVVPIVSSYTGHIIPVGDQTTFGPQYLARQCRGTVDFVGAIQTAAAAEGASIHKSLWIETGPDPVLLGLLRKTLPEVGAKNLLGCIRSKMEDNWASLSSVLKSAYESGVDIEWPEFHRDFKECVRLLQLPLYAFDFRDFWHEPFKGPKETIQAADAGKVHNCSCSQSPEPSAKSPFPPSFPGFPTTTLPTVESEDMDAAKKTISAVFSADTSEPELLRAIEGHVVLNHVICPMSILVDMALTAAKYCHFRLHGETKIPAMSVSNIKMNHALVLHSNMTKRPIIRVKTVMRKDQSSADVQFSWLKFSDGKADPVEEEGGSCTANFETEEKWPASVNSSLFLVKSRIAALRAAGLEGRAHRLLKPVIYGIFAQTVNYSEPFRGIDEVVLDLNCQDAIAKVNLLPDASSSGNFVMNPYWTDALTHLGGFFLNSGLRYPQQDLLCMARGFDLWRVVGLNGTTMQPGQTYTNYTFMQDVEGNFVTGDCYIFDENDNLVQTLLGLKFQKLKRSVMDAVFGTVPSTNTKLAPKPSTKQHDRKLSIKVNNYGPSDAISWAEATRRSVPSTPSSSLLSPSSSMSGSLITPASSISGDNHNHKPDAANLMKTIMSIVAQEAGCRLDELTDEAVFADLGVDSLMGISILAVIKRETGVDLDSTFFIQFETVKDAKVALEDILGLGHTDEASSQSTREPPTASDVKLQRNPSKVYLPPTPPPEHAESKAETPDCSPIQQTNATSGPFMATCLTPPLEGAEKTSPSTQGLTGTATLVHFSGPKATPVRNIFLLADETGSSLQCLQLPLATTSNGSPVSAWGVEPKFAKQQIDPETHSVHDLAIMSLKAIREKQHIGSTPFLLGGIGAGAAVAIEVARIIQQESPKDCLGLVLLDPSLTSNAVERASSARDVRLNPAKRDLCSAMAQAMGRYSKDLISLPPLEIEAVAIVSESGSPEQELLAQVLPRIRVKSSDIPPGKGLLMRAPTLASTNMSFSEAVRELS
ncbi:hypothetical protein PspLS_08702 [Pyricularia sp. CBS 133598]|nr:hypothetical protein PspLS_08702 [Pyricularia sp. CBS 133598]